LFDAAPQPIYLLDGELTVVFLNGACRDWLGPAAEGLLGRQCRYHSDSGPEGPDAVAAGLCPPSAVLDGQSTQSTVSCPAVDGATRWRRANFIPLGGSGSDVIGLVAVLDADDLAGQMAVEDVALSGPGVEGTSAELHEQIGRFRRELAARSRSDHLIGDGPAIRRVRRQVELAAGSRCSVLLVGPSGSGRQRTAAAIHYRGIGATVSGRTSGSLIPLACSVLGADLIGSTITALSAGSPLGDEAGCSTLLLNDADRLPLEVQGELTRLLLFKPFPLRLIATAGQPLGELVSKGKYRADLAAGLSTITIELPPLARRREDLPLLAQAFLEEFNSQGARQLSGFTPEALDALDAHAWPGNLDELAQVVAAACQRAAGREIGVDDLPEQIHLAARAAAFPPKQEETIVLDEFLARVERELIDRAMTQAKGNKAKAARLLGMTRPRLYRRLVQLGMEEAPGTSDE
jgi:DNA-binding NtrC family response regulator